MTSPNKKRHWLVVIDRATPHHPSYLKDTMEDIQRRNAGFQIDAYFSRKEAEDRAKAGYGGFGASTARWTCKAQKRKAT